MPPLLLLLGAALLALAIARVVLGYPRLPAPGRALWRGEWATVAAAAEALFPPGGAIPPSGRDAGLPAFVDRYVAGVPPRVRLLMRLLLFAVEHGTLLFPAPGRGGWRRLSALRPEQRAAALESWRGSRWFARRLVFVGLRSMLTMGYLAHPPVLRALRLAPWALTPPVVEADLLYPPIGRPRSAVRYAPADLTPPSDGTPLEVDGPLHPDYAEDPP